MPPKSGHDKRVDKRKKELQEDAKSCKKLKDMFAARPGEGLTQSSVSPAQQSCNSASVPEHVNDSSGRISSVGEAQSETAAADKLPHEDEVDKPADDQPQPADVYETVPHGETDTEPIAAASSLSAPAEFDEQNVEDQGQGGGDDDELLPESRIEELVDCFTPPARNAPVAVKMAFMSLHPAQTARPGLCFDPSRVFTRKLPDGTPIQRKWVSYNHETNMLFCSTCMAFGSGGTLSKFLTGVVPDPQHIYQSVERHEASKAHKDSTEAFAVNSACQTSSDQLTGRHKRDVEKRRQVLDRIIAIICYLAVHDSAFRGHRKEAAYELAEDEDSDTFSSCGGKFLSLVLLLARYDPVLKDHVAACARKSAEMKKKGTKGRGGFVSFLSKSTVNKILSIIGEQVRSKILHEVREAKMFSIELDTTQDVTAVDQMAVCLKYLKGEEVQDRFVALIDIRDSTGAGIYSAVKKLFDTYEIEANQLIGESTDGGSNFAGVISGLRGRIKELSPEVIHVYDTNHNLNIAVENAINVAHSFQDFFLLLKRTSAFFRRNHQRADAWREMASTQSGSDKLRRCQQIGETRWVSKHDATTAIFHSSKTAHKDRIRFVNLVDCLHQLGYEMGILNGEASAEARRLLSDWSKFSTILTGFFALRIFEAVNPATVYLQTRGIDLIAAVTEIRKLRAAVEAMDDHTFDDIADQALGFSRVMNEVFQDNEEVEFEEELPVGRTKRVKRMPGEIASDEGGNLSGMNKYRVDVFRLTMDRLKADLNYRFKEMEELFVNIAPLDPRNFENIRKDKFDVQMDFLARKLAVEVNRLDDEVRQFAKSFNGIKGLLQDFHRAHHEDRFEIEFDALEENVEVDLAHEPSSASATVRDRCAKDERCNNCIVCAFIALRRYNYHIQAYPTLYMAYKFAMTLSCSQVQCERAFSKLRLIKDRLRANLGQSRLEHLMIVSMEKDLLPSDFTEILDTFARSSKELSRLLF
jgi:hypothetical protein